MKKWLITLAAVLLLSGCGQVQETVPTAQPTQATEPPRPAETCYVSDSVTERGTDGAVKQYAMDAAVEGFTRMGDGLLVYTADAQLSLLGGEDLQVLYRRQLENPLDWTGAGMVVTGERLAYFDAETDSYVTLSGTLSMLSQAQVTGGITAGPVMASDFNTVYYAQGTGIRALDLGTGVSRLLRQENAEIVSIDGVFFGGTVLRYTRRLADGALQTCFVDSEDGSAFHTADFHGQLVSWENRYAGILTSSHPLGQTGHVVCGDLDGTLRVLETAASWERALFPGQGLVILQRMEQLGLSLRCYSLDSGSLMAAVMVPHREEYFALGCVDGGRIWLGDGVSEKFFCWDTGMTPAEENDGSLENYYSLGSPDEEGMARCMAKAEALEDRFGVVISFDRRDNRTTGVDYDGYLDYQPRMYAAALAALETALNRLPDWLPERMAQCTEKDRLEIVLVDDFDPARGYPGGEGTVSMDGGQATVWVSMSAELEQLLYHQLFHVAEVRIQNTRDGFSDWEDMNPEGFVYAGEEAYAAGMLQDSEYLTFGTNYFADEYGMVGPREDRAQIFVYAVMEGQEERFASEAMQAKLERICYLLRKAYWMDKGEMAVWEQYLLPNE